MLLSGSRKVLVVVKMEKIYCPMKTEYCGTCDEGACAWWSYDWNRCCIKDMAVSLDAICQLIKESEK